MFGDLWIILFIILIVSGILAGQGVVIALGVMGLLVGSVSRVWSKLSLERVTYERSMSHRRIFRGEEVSLVVSITNKKPIPLGWLQAEDDIPEELELIGGELETTSRPKTRSLQHATSMASYERVHWSYKLTSRQRGFYRIGPARLKSGDLFGFFPSERVESDRDYLLVYPRVVPLPQISLPPARPLGETRGGLKIFEDPSRHAGIRDYQPGDPFKIVDWKATAKHQSLQVKVFEPTVIHNLVVILNADTSVYRWEGYAPLRLERVVTAAASLASYGFENRYSVGLFSNSTPLLADRPLTIPPSRNPQQLPLILEALATVGPITSMNISKMLGQEAHKFPLGATLIVATALLPEEMVETMGYLVRLGYKLVVVYVGDDKPPDLPRGVILHELGPYLDSLESPFSPHAR